MYHRFHNISTNSNHIIIPIVTMQEQKGITKGLHKLMARQLRRWRNVQSLRRILHSKA